MADVWIGLGGNLGDVRQTFQQALAMLQDHGLSLIQCSSLYRTTPVGPQDQPDFLNAVVRAQTALGASQLLDALLATETSLGRERSRHWGERTLDLDLLLYDTDIIHTARLTVPHPALTERAFVLVPMAELDPAHEVPGTDCTVGTLLERCNRDGVWYHGLLSG